MGFYRSLLIRSATNSTKFSKSASSSAFSHNSRPFDSSNFSSSGWFCNWRRSLCHGDGNVSSKSGESSSSSISSASYHLSGGPSYMRGAVFWEPNKPLTFEDFHMPRPKAGEVLIKTKACGVCHSDLHVMKGELPFASPCVVGHEITGEVVEHGPLTDSRTIERFPVGAHVVGAFIMPCGSCFFCTKGQDDLCEAFFAYNRAKGTLYDGETRLFLRSSGN
ncbi:unnamed protein product [Ilex paraguariensis]|uniref:Alcohol dehydrogenase-like N-terminal domain-containing protein n=1 Tax=Ilex paraguariensis TaxID=185542 RepID=A0ABC8T2Q7_9AQUA